LENYGKGYAAIRRSRMVLRSPYQQ